MKLSPTYRTRTPKNFNYNQLNLSILLYNIDPNFSQQQKIQAIQTSYEKIPSPLIKNVIQLPEKTRGRSFNNRYETIQSSRIKGALRSLHNPHSETISCETEEETKVAKRRRRFAIIDIRNKSTQLDSLVTNSLIQFFQPQVTQESIPAWVRNRNDFARLYYRESISQAFTIPQICCKQPNSRTLSEMLVIKEYLKSTIHFQSLGDDILEQFAYKFSMVVFVQGETVLRENEQISYFGIVYEGTCLAYDSNEIVIKRYKRGDLIFRDLYLNNSLKAKNYFVVLFLSKTAYEESLQVIMDVWARDFIPMINQNSFFHQFRGDVQSGIQKRGSLRLYLKNEIANSKEFSIVYRGSLIRRTLKPVENRNRWPKGVKQWELRSVRLFYSNIQKLKECDFFGEPIDSYTSQQVIAESNCLLITLTKEAFFEIFGTVEKFINHRQKQGSHEFLEKKLHQKAELHQKKVALMKALNLMFSDIRSPQDLEKVKPLDKIPFRKKKGTKDLSLNEDNIVYLLMDNRSICLEYH